MPIALLIYAVFLAIEAGVAWLLTGNPFLAAAASCGLLLYSAVWRWKGPWSELVRAVFAGVIAVAGPLIYHGALVPVVMCFLALPHLLAATQCFWEMALRKDPSAQNAKMRTVVFTIGFYSALGLAFMLLRGMEPVVSGWITGALALVVVLLALPAWDVARVARLKPGAPMPAPAGGTLRRWLVAALAAAGAALLFSALLPPAAQKLCEISPRWKADLPVETPPVVPQSPPQNEDGGEVSRPGADSSDMTGQHRLPDKSNLQSTGEVRLYVKCTDPEDARRLSTAPVYVRTHTFDSYRDGVWKSAVIGGRWLDDGDSDGWTDCADAPAGLRKVEHAIFLQGADGYSLPALAGVTGYQLPRVYAVPGDLYQAQINGAVRYGAVSAPCVFDQLPNQTALETAGTGNEVHLACTGGQLITEFAAGEALLRGTQRPVAEKVAGLRRWLAERITYSPQMTGHATLSALDNFLLSEKRGYCDFYAAASCLILRECGVPSRVAYGYAARQFDAKRGLFVFTDDSAHAWTEIHLRGYGWTVCDFTPPQNIGDIDGQQEETPPPPFDEKNYEQQGREEQQKPEQAATEDAGGFAGWWRDTLEKIQSGDTAALLRQAMIWLGAAAVVSVLLRRLWKKKAAAAGDDPFAADTQQPLYFREFLRVFSAAGWPRAEGATPREYFQSLQHTGAAGGEFDPMMEYHYALRYAGAGSDSRREQEWLDLVRAAERRFRDTRSQT